MTGSPPPTAVPTAPSADGLTDEAQLVTLWRTKLRSSIPGVDHAAQVEHCLTNGLIGIGWRMDGLPAHPTLDQAYDRAINTKAPGWGKQAADTIRRFGAEAADGDYVWTRDTHGRYRVCRLSGPYRYDGSPEAQAVDVHQVRDALWAPRPLNDLEVPGGVIRGFIGIGLSFSRIHNAGARKLTPYLWEKLHDRPLRQLEISAREVLEQHLDPYDVEDLIYVWLQFARGYIALPRTRQHDTPAYEWTMIHRKTGQRAIAQVKTGGDQVDLQALAEARADTQTTTFAFATSEQYDGDHDLVDEIIPVETLLDFVAQNLPLLPIRVKTWFELAKQP